MPTGWASCAAPSRRRDCCTSAGIPVIEPSNFNGASIAIGDMAGSKTVKRRLTNVSGKHG